MANSEKIYTSKLNCVQNEFYNDTHHFLSDSQKQTIYDNFSGDT